MKITVSGTFRGPHLKLSPQPPSHYITSSPTHWKSLSEGNNRKSKGSMCYFNSTRDSREGRESVVKYSDIIRKKKKKVCDQSPRSKQT